MEPRRFALGGALKPRLLQRGPREELVRSLSEMSDGWWHLSKDELQVAAARGAYELATGAFAVRVGHTIYEVADG